MREIAVGDIGGTHARFAIARQDGPGIALSQVTKLKVADHASLQSAWQAFVSGLGGDAPSDAVFAVAAPVDGDLLKLTNNPWIIRPALIAERLGLESARLINDFAAVAHAVGVSRPTDFLRIAGPDHGLPEKAVVSVVGPGTGLGVAAVLMDSPPRVIATEGGHVDFAPLDAVEDRILSSLRLQYRRVSVERVVAGPGLAAIHAVLAAMEEKAVQPMADAQLWEAAIAGTDRLAQAALDRWCLSLGSVAGDLLLAQGGEALVLAGGLIPRIGASFPASGFHSRFLAKGRFEARMARIPIFRITHAEPGLLGAAAAYFTQER